MPPPYSIGRRDQGHGQREGGGGAGRRDDASREDAKRCGNPDATCRGGPLWLRARGGRRVARRRASALMTRWPGAAAGRRRRTRAVLCVGKVSRKRTLDPRRDRVAADRRGVGQGW